MSETFPQWGFWIYGHGRGRNDILNLTNKRHLFTSETKTACGIVPKYLNEDWTDIRFSAEPRVNGLFSTWFELSQGRLLHADDFRKCKKCLKKEAKLNE